MRFAINQNRLTDELNQLGAISAEPAPVVTRVVFTDADLRARQLIKQLCVAANLQLREDPVGNTFARWVGSEPQLPPVGTGSHLDAIPNAGRFDGTVGVLGALEAIRSLQLAGWQPPRSIELVLFTSEEPTRFGIGCLGSRLLSGSLPPSCDETLKDGEGHSLNTVRRSAGFTGDLAHVVLPPGAYAAFVELHIEQGAILEQEHLDIGVVTAIAAPSTLRVLIEGEGGHAGAVLMPQRHDAFLAAAEIALAVEHAAKASGSEDTVGTTGVCDLFPRAVNSIPSRVRMEIDVRDTEGNRRDSVLTQIQHDAARICRDRGVSLQIELLNADPPAQCSPAVVDVLEQACRAQGISHRRLISRAYHDSLFLSLIAPTAMLFIPCRGGVSHRPDEYSSPDAIAAGVRVLAESLLHLAGEAELK